MIDSWIQSKIGLPQGEALTRSAIESYQLERLRATLLRAKSSSRFYADKLAGIEPGDIADTSCLAGLPFTFPSELTEQGTGMVCVPASEISRIVTLPTSGTTGEPKRIYFTEADQELMIDYIHHGLRVMTGPGDVFLVLMPCERPGSVGDLVRVGLERMGVKVIALGILPPDGSRDAEVLELMQSEGINSMLATASAAVRLAAADIQAKKGCGASMRTLLLSAEYVSDEGRNFIEAAWQCEVFEHYGMTEMGLGGAMACEARSGYHPREADLIFEIIDPATGAPLPDGEPGELVFTTLTREAMPFIRYRTGDFSRWIPGDCSCGSVLRRLDRVGDRKLLKGY
ncbi:MAG: AMP-binding protein [Oscillospiraceae bacterium]|jgi:phenylacetate-coenzyme A ligase PaaK-like adenylate-forming protein|nr:AMP-binding protein [Oscillospiraceae bacterium]